MKDWGLQQIIDALSATSTWSFPLPVQDAADGQPEEKEADEAGEEE